MLKKIVFGIILIGNFYSASGQYQWQDPLNFDSFNPTGKYGFLLNIGGAVLTSVFNKKDYKSQWRTSVYFDYASEYNSSKEISHMFGFKIRHGKQLSQFLQLGGEGQLYYFFNNKRQAIGAGGAIYFNWYLINNNKFMLYFNNAYGIVLTNKPFPEGGTRFNFNRYYGLSTSFIFNEDKFLIIGVRTMHISNAYLFGDDNNPAFDGLGLHIGIHF